MREICQSGSEGGARFYPLSLPLYRAAPLALAELDGATMQGEAWT
jgi:hypothetical protein